MNARFELQPAEHVPALHQQRRFLYAAQLGLIVVGQFGLPAALFGIVNVHPHKLRAEQSGFLAARARAHLDDGVAIVVRIARKQPQPRLLRHLLQLWLQRFQLLAPHLGHVGIVARSHGARFAGVLKQPAIGRGKFGQLAHLAVLAHELCKQRRVRDHLGQRHAHAQLLEAIFNVLQLAGNALVILFFHAKTPAQ